MNEQNERDEFIKESFDIIAMMIRLLSLGLIGGSTYGVFAAYRRIKNMKDSIDAIAQESPLYSTGEVGAPTLTYSVMEMLQPKVILKGEKEKKDKDDELSKKGFVEYENLTKPEQKLYDTLINNPMLLGFLPFTILVGPAIAGIGLNKLISTMQQKRIIDEAEQDREDVKKEFIEELGKITRRRKSASNGAESVEASEPQSLGISGTLKSLLGLGAAMQIFLFSLFVPFFYNIFSKKQYIKHEDIIRQKLILKKLPSPIPVMVNKNLLGKELEDIEQEIT